MLDREKKTTWYNGKVYQISLLFEDQIWEIASPSRDSEYICL